MVSFARNKAISHPRVGVLLLLLCQLLCSCEEESHNHSPLRTLLFYLCGDNNLSSEVAAKIEQIRAAPISPACRVVIYADTHDARPQLWEVLPAARGNTLQLVQEYAESNSADAEVFSSILSEVKERYPSPSYGLVLFSHATGWLPEGAYDNPSAYSRSADVRSVIKDGNSEMEIQAFAAAIPDGMLDFIVFEACHMASVEVAYELKDKTQYIVASSAEIVSPGFARCYAKALPLLYQHQADLQGFCQVIENDYATRPGDYSSLTLSLIDTKELGTLAAVMRESDSLLPTDGTGIQTFDRGSGTLFFDLEDCYTRAEKLQQAAIGTAIGGCVKWKTATAAFMPTYGGFEIRAHCGLTIYIPQQDYCGLNEAYKRLKWYEVVMNKERVKKMK